MKRCIKCLKPNTLPGVVFSADGVCPACERFENRKNIDYSKRREFLTRLCDEFRRTNGKYDCIIPVSGGKDSYFQTYLMTQVYKMNPLLVCVTDPFEHTGAGTHNYQNLGRAFGCDMITLTLNPEFVAKSSVATFRELGSTNWAVDKAIYAWPLNVALEKDIRLVVYGENVAWEYGGMNAEDTYNANKQINNDVVKGDGEEIIKLCDPEQKNYNALRYPSTTMFDMSGVQAIYASYFYPWNDLINVAEAEKWGFRCLGEEWNRQGFLDDYAQIDSVGYLFNYYLKFMKYGIGRVVDIGSRWVRYGKITKEQLAAQIEHKEGRQDDRIVRDFLRVTNLGREEFLKIMSKWWNYDIFEIDHCGGWHWKDPIL